MMQFLGWNAPACRKATRWDDRIWPGADRRLPGTQTEKLTLLLPVTSGSYRPTSAARRRSSGPETRRSPALGGDTFAPIYVIRT